MRIVYCLPEMSHPGGIGRVTAIKANYLVEHNYEVHIVTSNQFDSPMYYRLNPKIKHIDMGIGFQAGGDNGNLIKKYIRRRCKMRLYRKKLEAFLYNVKADIVVSTFNNDSDFLYKLEDGSRKVLEYHFSHDGYKSQIKNTGNSFSHKLFLILRLLKQERVARKYDAFVVLTHEDAKAWKGYKNLHVIPNMLSFEPQNLSSCESKRVIAVGRLDSQKSFNRLLDIWYDVHKECPEWKLIIFGTGVDELILQTQIKNLKLSNVVSISKPTKKIEKEYLKSSVLCMTSTYEGWGLVLTEAMSCGVPCVAYACKCGPRDIIENGVNGFCINEGNKTDFVRKLVQLMKDDSLRKSFSKGAKYKSNQYKKDIIMPIWQSLFEMLLSDSVDKN